MDTQSTAIEAGQQQILTLERQKEDLTGQISTLQRDIAEVKNKLLQQGASDGQQTDALRQEYDALVLQNERLASELAGNRLELDQLNTVSICIHYLMTMKARPLLTVL